MKVSMTPLVFFIAHLLYKFLLRNLELARMKVYINFLTMRLQIAKM